ncbi:gpW family head-tail joining protein [Labrys portucalensis]|uniref:GpW family head-tail joining protein n=1 Tax=Labrys neptuniae TaxID=376174 RepID=A0ABV6ZJX2_9HYPH
MDPAQALAAARSAYHKLMTGTLAVKVVIDGQETTFNQVNAGLLAKYIAELEAIVAGQPRRGAIGVIF